MLDIEDIKGSIQNQRLLDIQRSVKFNYDASGRLRYHTGGYAVIFPCEINGEKKALRCWHTAIAGSDERYKEIAASFTRSGLFFLVEFEYHVQALTINGIRYPVMITKWMDGINIKDYVWENRYNARLLSTLSRRFLTMCAEMNGRQISHGDIQHGNIIIRGDGRPKLIDYDSVWTPEMGDETPDIIKGLSAYQHPGRKENKYGFNGIDFFAQLVVYLSILAVIHNPSLSEKYHFADSEHMLFSAADYTDWQHSEVRDDLCRLHDEEIDYLVTMMDCYLEIENITKLPSFYHY